MAIFKDLIRKKKVSCLIPKPILSLGCNYFLQHQRPFDFATFINNTYTSSSYSQQPSLTQTGVDWANDSLKVGISYAHGNDWDFFKENTPMIFMEVLNTKGKGNQNRHLNRSQWTHPVNRSGTLNRTATNYGGGDALGLITEWDFTASEFQDQVIELNQQYLYYNSSITLPQRKVDFVTINTNNLKYQRSIYGSHIDNFQYVVNTFNQPIRFRFGVIDDENPNGIILGEPSDVLIVGVKSGYFEPDDDHYIYDWTLKFK